MSFEPTPGNPGIQSLADRIASGDLRALARAATWVENSLPQAEPLLEALFPRTGRALVLGVTGPPGAGKSTLTDQLIQHYRQQGKTVGVIAVDPSSPYSGGAILGDRIRMQRHHADDGVFIRSMATRGHLGGLARAATEMTLLLDASGRDVIIIETVGVGQDEVEIARLAAITVVMLVPGMGDDVQAIKAGILEIADIFVINKADQPGADQLERELRAAADLAHGRDIPIVRTTASEGIGMDQLLATIATTKAKTSDPETRAQLWAERLRQMLRERLLDAFNPEQFLSAGRAVAEGRQDPYAMLRQWAICDTRPMEGKIEGKAEQERGLHAALPELSKLAPGRIDHLGIAVKSIDESLTFYRDQLGLRVSLRETVVVENVHAAMLPVGESRIELLEAAAPDSVIAKFIEKRGEGLHHIALIVPDLDATVVRLRASGVRVLNDPRPGAGGHLYSFVHPASTGGVLLELIQEHHS